MEAGSTLRGQAFRIENAPNDPVDIRVSCFDTRGAGARSEAAIGIELPGGAHTAPASTDHRFPIEGPLGGSLLARPLRRPA